MKTFWSNFFSSLLALITFSVVSTILSIVVLIGIIGVISSKKSANAKIQANSILVIKTNQIVVERSEDESFFEAVMNDNNPTSILRFKEVIQNAKFDKNIVGIVIKTEGASNNLAISYEISEALKTFKSSGKKLIAYGNFNEKDYLIASMADKIYASPIGVFEWNGFGVHKMFYKKLMDKLDVNAQVFYAGKFKSATEPFRRENMSEEDKLQTKQWLEGLQQELYETISTNRKIPFSKLKEVENKLLIKNVQDALKYHFIDGIKFSDEVEAELKKDLNYKEDEELKLVSFDDYDENAENKTDTLKNNTKQNIAVIYANGTIVNGGNQEEGEIAADKLVKTIRKITKDTDIKGIVLRINSPGGDAQASEKIWRAVKLAEKEKPLVVSMGQVCASGGYYIASGANYLFAEPFTITGSIGVFALIPNVSSFLDKKIGITSDYIGTSEHSFFTIVRPLTTMQKQFIQNHIDTIYSLFKTRVATARNLNMTQVENIAQGRVWVAKKALENKLVDKIGNLDSAINYIAQKIGTQNIEIEEYPQEENKFEKIINKISKKIQTLSFFQWNALTPEIKSLESQLIQTKKMFNEGQAQIKLPFNFDIY